MIVPMAHADDPPDLFYDQLLPFIWTGGAGTNWQDAGNWTAPTFPGSYPYAQPTYPDDPNRPFDEDDVTIEKVIGADLSVALSSNLTISLTDLAPTSTNDGEDDVFIASLKLGSTSNPVITEIASATTADPEMMIRKELLVFQNFEINDITTNPGDDEADPEVFPEPIYAFNRGRALIWSTGVAGVTNRISADVRFDDNTIVEGDRDLTISGDIYEGILDRDPEDAFNEGGGLEGDPGALPSSLSSHLSGGATLYITGNIISGSQDADLSAAGTQERPFFINSDRGIPLPPDPQRPDEPSPVQRLGTIDISGQLIGNGRIYMGGQIGNLTPMGTIILRGDNSGFTGSIYHDRSNLVLDHDNALGAPTDQTHFIEDPEDPPNMIEVPFKGNYKSSNPNQGFGFNFISTDDDRKISTDMNIAQWQTVKGATSVPGLEAFGDHSIEFAGNIEQENTRGWVNLLPYDHVAGTGKTLTLSGYQSGLDGDDEDAYRIYTVDGTGRTIITGGIHDRPVDTTVFVGNTHFRKRGTGTVVIDYDEANTVDSASNFTGHVWVQGGNLHFAEVADLPDPTAANFGQMVSTAGAVGLDSGVLNGAGGGDAFLNLLNNKANPNQAELTAPFYLKLEDNIRQVFSRYDHGGLMLGTGEYDEDLDFTTGLLSNAQDMSLAAWENGSEYTGTITPHNATYRLGGGSGALTLPDANQLTGARNLVATNGGRVVLPTTHDYTGTTTIEAKRITTATEQATNDGADVEVGAGAGDIEDNNQFTRTTVIVSTLANGGVDSSIGKSSSDAANLWLQGSTLKYVGGATTTDRLFTVGTTGGTVDASGTGPLVLSNEGALAIDIAEDRLGYVNGGLLDSSDNEVFGSPTRAAGPIPFDTSDLVEGMTIFDSTGPGSPYLLDDDSPIRITEISGPDIVQVGETDLDDDDADDPMEPQPWAGYGGGAFGQHNFQFGPAPARYLTLTGTNTSDNTLTPVVTDASDVGEDPINADYGSVGIRKAGVGTWVLAGANTYSGETQVQAGTLKVTGSTGSGDTRVFSGATLMGDGNVGGDLIVHSGGTVNPGLSPGTLTVGDNFSLSVGGQLTIEIAGTGVGQYDLLEVLGDGEVANAGTEALDGDYNENGFVDAADYAVWRDAMTAGATVLANDDTPGVVDESDFFFWRDNFGDSADGSSEARDAAILGGSIFIDLLSFSPTVGNMFTVLTAQSITNNGLSLSGDSAGFELIVNPTNVMLHYVGGAGAGAGSAAVPEPSSICLAVLGLLAGGFVRRRR
jgi:autotransporter-associated beta strand protein